MSAAGGGRWARLRRFAAHPAAERRLWCEAWWSLLGADLALRLSARRALERALAADDDLAARRPAPAGATWAVASAAAHHLWPMHCLPRALTLHRLLARRGIPSRVRIGIRKQEGALAAHAWVEVGGAPLGEPAAIEARFVPLVARTDVRP